MSKIDQEYVSALNSYNKSLEKVVELLQQQVKSKDTDVLETMLKNMDGDKLKKIVDDLNEVKETGKRIEGKIDKIAKELKTLKSQRDSSGPFGQIANPKDKNKIIDGIKIITLIAGGVLAIGMAFKLIGHVDILSVIALGISISLVAATFAIVNEKFKTLTFGRTLVLVGMMLVASWGIMTSSRLLALTAPMSLKTMISVTFTALAVGAALYLMSEAVHKIKFGLKTIFGLMLLPFLAPIVSMAIVKSSWILKNAATIDFKTILSVTFTSIALGIALYSITTAISKMNTKSSVIGMLTKGAMFGLIIASVAGGVVLASYLFSKIAPMSLMQGLTAIMVAVALGIVLFTVSKVIEFTEGISIMKALAVGALMVIAAWAIKKSAEILSGVKPWKWDFAWHLVMTAFAIGLSLLAFVPAWKMFGNSMFSKATAFSTAKNILIVAGTIVAVSRIISLGNYNGPIPSPEWSLGVGLSLLIFGGEVATLGFVVKKIGSENLVDGAIAALAVSFIIFASSWILAAGNYSTYPPLEWAAGVGLSILIFGGSMVGLGFLFEASGGIGIGALALGALGALMISTTIMLSSYILGAGSYGTYPNLEWSAGVGLSLLTFGMSTVLLGLFIAATFGGGLLILALGAAGTFIVASTIVAVSKILSSGTYDKGPSLDWAMGVGSLIGVVATTMLLTAFIPNKILEWGRESLMIVAQTIVDISKKIGEGTYSGGPDLDWVQSTGMLLATVGSSMLLYALLYLPIKLGSMSVLLMVNTIVSISKILSTGTYTGGPDMKWIQAHDLLLQTLSNTFLSIGVLMLIGFPALLAGVAASLLVANTIESISKILSSGNYKVIPQDWIDSTGLLLTSAGKSILDIGGLGLVALTVGSIATLMIAGTIVTVSKLLSLGNYGGIPSYDTIKNLDFTISTFINLSNREFSMNKVRDLENMVSVILSIVKKISSGKDLFDTSSLALNKFSLDLVLLAKSLPTREVVDKLSSLADSIMKISSIGLTTSLSIYMLSKSLEQLGDTIGDMDMTTFDKLTKFSSTFTAISLIDNMKLQQTIDTLKSKRLDIKAVVDDSSSRFASVQSNYTPGSVTTVNTPFMDTEKISNPLLDLVAYNRNIDMNIQEMLKIQKEGSKSPDNVTVSSASRFGNRL